MKSSTETLEEMHRDTLSLEVFVKDLEKLPVIEMPAPLDDSGIEAMRLALSKSKTLSASEALAFLEFRQTPVIRRSQSLWRVRRGKAAFRRQGVAGADLPYPPAEWDYRRAVKHHEVITTPGQREVPDPMLGVRARQGKADVRAQRVLALYPQYRHRGCHAVGLIARKLGEHDHYVRRILQKNGHDRNNRFR